MVKNLNRYGIVGHKRGEKKGGGRYKKRMLHVDRHICTIEATSIADAKKQAKKLHPNFVIVHAFKR